MDCSKAEATLAGRGLLPVGIDSQRSSRTYSWLVVHTEPVQGSLSLYPAQVFFPLPISISATPPPLPAPSSSPRQSEARWISFSA